MAGANAQRSTDQDDVCGDEPGKRRRDRGNHDYDMTLEEVATQLGISRERVGQIEREALKKLRVIAQSTARFRAIRELIAEPRADAGGQAIGPVTAR